MQTKLLIDGVLIRGEGAAERILELCCDHVRPYFDLGRREGLIRDDIEVEGDSISRM